MVNEGYKRLKDGENQQKIILAIDLDHIFIHTIKSMKECLKSYGSFKKLRIDLNLTLWIDLKVEISFKTTKK